MKVKNQIRRFQILSLDGGGIKGIFSAAALANIENDLKVSIIDHFDLIVGTSTGGVIALGLGLGMRPMEILHFYVECGSKIFSNNFGVSPLKHWLCRKYTDSQFHLALQKCFGNSRLADSMKRLVNVSRICMEISQRDIGV